MHSAFKGTTTTNNIYNIWRNTSNNESYTDGSKSKVVVQCQKMPKNISNPKTDNWKLPQGMSIIVKESMIFMVRQNNYWKIIVKWGN